MKFEIDQDLANQIANYLASRPFADVHQLIAKLQQLRPVQEVAPPQDPFKVVPPSETK